MTKGDCQYSTAIGNCAFTTVGAPKKADGSTACGANDNFKYTCNVCSSCPAGQYQTAQCTATADNACHPQDMDMHTIQIAVNWALTSLHRTCSVQWPLLMWQATHTPCRTPSLMSPYVSANLRQAGPLPPGVGKEHSLADQQEGRFFSFDDVWHSTERCWTTQDANWHNQKPSIH